VKENGNFGHNFDAETMLDRECNREEKDYFCGCIGY
jgi:hypothetical protein